MLRLIILTVFVTLVCAHSGSILDPRPNQDDLDAFRHELHEKYQDAKNSGQEGFQRFLDHLEHEKDKIDHKHDELKSQQIHKHDIRSRANVMTKYLYELKDKAIDEAKVAVKVVQDLLFL